jgi:retron-type reverse transcriptase
MLMERILSRGNLLTALKRVEKNKGNHGVDGMSVQNLRAHILEHWESMKIELLEGTYEPQAVRRIEIPKPDGGVRLLGIPTVTDRLIQQAIAQVLTSIYDPTFSNHSYGFSAFCLILFAITLKSSNSSLACKLTSLLTY